ncbi:MAG TPA: S8 family serine peptidase [Vicinamibacteria bacterium]|nr:S8 family serine peptidase [Vicinamibacteria bacterium]
MSRILRVGEAKGVRARSSTTLLRARGSDAPPPRVYERLGIAVADLDDDQLRRVRLEEQVAGVVPNEQCFAPAAFPGPDGEGGIARGASARATEDTSAGGHSWCLDLVGVPAGHPLGGRGVTVAVLDTGVDLGHPDLAGRFEEGWNAVSFVPGEGVQDGHGHGTHCAGVVGGPRRSSSGTRYAVAPDVRLLAGKVLSDAGCGFSDWILDGIDWATENQARVIALSCVSRRGPGQPYSVVYERIAENLREGRAGTLLLAAAGNASERPWYTRAVDNPGACPSLMAVAAVHRAGRIAFFSGRQMDEIGEVNLSAPGVGVHSAWTGGGFRTMSGTSMAVPHVAGVAALYLEEQPTLSARNLWRALQTRAQPLGDVRDFGGGLVQAGTAGGESRSRGGDS